jgi:hypothetical protein
MVLDTTKAEYIRDRFSSDKIGIFYVFKEELVALKSIFLDDLTTDIDEFNSGKFHAIALQTVSGREGISLKNADYLVFYNIMHSAVSYWQARDRMTTIDRLNNKVFWIFSENGIEDKINNGERLRFINDDGSMDAIISINFFSDLFPREMKDASYPEKRQWLKDNNIIYLFKPIEYIELEQILDNLLERSL